MPPFYAMFKLSQEKLVSINGISLRQRRAAVNRSYTNFLKMCGEVGYSRSV